MAMIDRVTRGGQGLIDDWNIRHFIASLLQTFLNELSADHYNAATQEPPLTARAGERLELGAMKPEFVARLEPFGYAVRIMTLDIPAIGPGSLERPTGTDLYVGVEVTIDGERSTKGFLVQAKWNDKRSGDEEDRLKGQCKKMLKLSKSAYVWEYGPEGINVRSAQSCALHGAARPASKERGLEDLFESVFECVEGDTNIGLPERERPRDGLEEMLKRVAAENGLAVSVTGTRRRRRPAFA